MRTLTRAPLRARRLLCAAILSCGASGLVACGHAPTEVAASGTAHAPAAKAEIDVEDEGTHRDVDVQISDLPAPTSLGTGHTRYGVWLRTATGAPTSMIGSPPTT